MKKLIKKALTRLHKLFSSRERPKNIEEEEDISAFRKFVDKENLSVFQILIRKFFASPTSISWFMIIALMNGFNPSTLLFSFIIIVVVVLLIFSISRSIADAFTGFSREAFGDGQTVISGPWINYLLLIGRPKLLLKLKKDKIGTPIG